MMVCISLYTIIDALFIARFINVQALGALNIVLPVYSIAFACGIMFATGGGAIIGIQLGENKKEQASRNFTQLILVGVIFGILATIICLFFRVPLITALGATGKLTPYALDYGLYAILSFPFLISKIIFENMLRVDGKPALALVCTILGGIVNIVLDYILIVHAKMGIAGAGLGTLIGIGITLPISFYYFSSKKSLLSFRATRLDFSFIRNTCFNGSSEMVNEAALALSVFVMNMLALRQYGEDGVPAISIILNLHFLLSSIYIGFSEGVMPLLSYNYGAKNSEKIKKTFIYSRNFLFFTSPISFIVCIFFAPQLVQIFTNSDSNVYNIALEGLRWFSICFVFTGVNIFASAMFTAFSNGKISALISFLKTFVFFIVGALVLPLLFNSTGIWLIVPASEFIAIILAVILIRKYRKDYMY